MDSILNTLSGVLNEVRKKVIGIAFISKRMELVLNDDDGYLTVISVSRWGALHTTHINKDMVSRCIMFEGYSSLYELLQSPFEFAEFCYKHNI